MRWMTLALLASLGSALAEPMPVRQMQNSMQKSLIVRSESGAVIAQGDLQQVTHGTDVSIHLVYKFRDGSVDDEMTEFSQRGVFRLVRNHHLQMGPYFPRPLDLSEDMTTGMVTSRDQKGKADTTHFKLPDDLANGMLGTLLLNAKSDGFRASYLAPVGKGKLVQLGVISDGDGDFRMAGIKKTAHIFRVKVELGGLTALMASAVRMRPVDTRVWVVDDELVRIQGQMYVGGPIVSIESTRASFDPARNQ